MNYYGLYTLFAKELKRFLKVGTQTVLTPVVIILLYLLVFSSVLSEHVQVYEGVSYTSFLIPGLMMMSIIQNAFANSSSSLFQSKLQGNIVFMLLSPLSSVEIFLAFAGAAIIRGLLVGIGVWLVVIWFIPLPIYDLLTLLSFAMLGSSMLGAFGLIAALWADKWDHVSAFQNFIVVPLSFLSGAFYSIHSLPPFWQQVSHYNPFFYLIDGFRYGFFGESDTDIQISLIVASLVVVLVSLLCIHLLKIGYRIRG